MRLFGLWDDFILVFFFFFFWVFWASLLQVGKPWPSCMISIISIVACDIMLLYN